MLSDAFETLVVRVLGIGLMFAMTTLTARLLGADEYGAFSAAWALAILLATLAPVGSDRVLVRNLSTVETPEQAGKDTAAAHVCTGLIALQMLAAVAVLGFRGEAWGLRSSWLRTAFLAITMFLPIAVAYLRQWVAIPLTGTRAAVIPEQISLPVLFMGFLLLAKVSGVALTATVAAVLFALSMVIVWLVSISRGPLRLTYRSALGNLPGPSLVVQRAREGIPFVSVAIGGVVLQRCLPVIIAAACGFRATALFALGLQYAGVPEIPLGVINLCMIPRCARHYQHGEFDKAHATVRLAATMTFCLAVILAIVTWTIGPTLIALLGRSFQGIDTILPTLLLASIVNALPGPAIPVMHTMKLESLYSRMLLAFLPAQLVLIWLGCQVADLEGGAMAYLIGRIVWNASIIIAVWRTRRILCLPFMSLEHVRYLLNSQWSAEEADSSESKRSLAA